MQTSRFAKKRLGDMLVENKLITEEQLQQALANKKKMGKRLGEVLIDTGLIEEKDILNTLELQLGIPQISILDKIDTKLVKSIPEQLIRRHQVIPVRKDGNRMMVAMFDPLNVLAIDDLKITTNCEIDPVITTQKEIKTVIQRVYQLSFLEDAVSESQEQQETVDTGRLNLDSTGEDADESLAVKLVNSIIKQAMTEKASDIHIEPTEEDIRVRYRFDGILHEAMNLPKSSQSSLITRLKILAQMDIAEKRLPQDGRFDVKHGNLEVDLRVSTLPTIYGEKVVMRLLGKSASLINIKQLGFQQANLNQFTKIIKHSYGLVLITGPTGSGKTTTLYAGLHELNSIEKNIVTIEDPVEYVLKGINQIQVNVKAGLTFAAGLRSILRQDPDIIMVGEIRDPETAEIAVRAASTGHLVLSTLHTNDAAGALTRLADMGVEPFLVSSAVLGVLSQRLVRLLCPDCKKTYLLPGDDPLRDFMGISPSEQITLYQAVGCSACNKLGYKGRISIQEVLPVSSLIRDMVKNQSSSQDIKAKAVEEGMITFKEDGIQKALQGLTTIQEVMRVAYGED